MNYFTDQDTAQRYARSRPYFHPVVIGHIQHRLKLIQPVAQALDAACGTGQSSRALRQIAEHVIGADISTGMLSQAVPEAGINYIASSSEALPLKRDSITLMTVALAFHWFDQERFLAEAARLLQAGGWLVIYNNWFSGNMVGNPEFARWNREQYLSRFRTPSRNRQPLGDPDVRQYGLRLVDHQRYTNDVTFSVPEFVSYLMSQSNVINALKSGSENEADVSTWLTNAITPMFTETDATFVFDGSIDYLQKQD